MQKVEEIVIDKPEVRPGYKKTKLGWVPKDWDVNQVKEYYDFKNGLNKGKEFFGYGTPIINYKDVYAQLNINRGNISGLVDVTKSEKERYSTKRGDVFFTRTSETILEIAYNSVLTEDISEGVFSGFVLRARPKDADLINPEFSGYCFKTFKARKEIIRKSTYTTRALTNGSFLSEVIFALPSLPEQKAIANCLSTWDNAINKQSQLIAVKEELKKALMQQLLTGKKRLPGFDREWRTKRFDHFLEYTPRPIKKPDISFTKLGIRSHCKGTFQHKNFEPEKIAIDTLYLVKPKDLIVNITFAWEGAVAIVKDKDEGALVSHRFPTYTFIEDISDADFFEQFIQSKRFRYLLELISPGGAGRNRVLSKKELNKLKIKIPSYNEQKALGEVLSSADKEIEVMNKQLAQLTQQKKGLMQQLLTGKKRLKF